MKQNITVEKYYFSSITWDKLNFTKKVRVFYSMTNEERNCFEQELNKKYSSMEHYAKENFYNLRHVVFELCHDNSLTSEQFAKEIGVQEKEIDSLIRDGECNAALLNKIADYFKLPIKKHFKQYVTNSKE